MNKNLNQNSMTTNNGSVDVSILNVFSPVSSVFVFIYGIIFVKR